MHLQSIPCMSIFISNYIAVQTNSGATFRIKGDVNANSQIKFLIFSGQNRKEIARPQFIVWALLKTVIICQLMKKIPLQKSPGSFFPSTTSTADGQHQGCNYQPGLTVPQMTMIPFSFCGCVQGAAWEMQTTRYHRHQPLPLKIYIYNQFPGLSYDSSINLHFTIRFPSFFP